MMKTGIIRRVDDLGRIVIPREIRNRLGIRDGAPLEISIEKDGVLFTQYDIGISNKLISVVESFDIDDCESDKKAEILKMVDQIKSKARELERLGV